MTKPESFILNSDYATLANDATNTVTLTTSTGILITPGTQHDFQSEITLGQKNAPIRALMNTSAEPSVYVPCESMVVTLTVLYAIDGNTYNYTTIANVYRISSTTIRLEVSVSNPFSFNITINGGVQTITADISTFLSPFET